MSHNRLHAPSRLIRIRVSSLGFTITKSKPGISCVLGGKDNWILPLLKSRARFPKMPRGLKLGSSSWFRFVRPSANLCSLSMFPSWNKSQTNRSLSLSVIISAFILHPHPVCNTDIRLDWSNSNFPFELLYFLIINSLSMIFILTLVLFLGRRLHSRPSFFPTNIFFRKSIAIDDRFG